MLAATVTIPLASMLNGPLVNGVTLVLAVVAAMPANVSFAKALIAVTTVLLEATVTGPSFTASIGLETTIVAVAVSQFAGVTFDPVDGLASHNWYVIVYVPDGVLAATVTIPLASILNGPLVNGVTLVLAVVAAIPANVSFVKAFTAVTTVLFEATVTGPSFTASIGLATTIVAVAVSQLDGVRFDPVDGLASHNW